MLHNPTGKERLALAFLLGMLAILGPLNIDMYLPSFPEIAEDLSASRFACPAQFNRLSDRTDNRTGCCRPVK